MVPDAMSALRADRERGFVVLAVLILVGLIALVGATYARHVTVATRTSPASLTSMRAASAVDSGLQYARQLLRTAQPLASASLADASATASVEITALDSEHSRLRLRSVDSRSIGSTLLCEVARTPLNLANTPDELPRIRSDAVTELMANPSVPKTWVSGLTTIQDTDFTGLVIIEDGGVLTLSGVALQGCIVSETTMTSLDYGPYDVIDAPTLIIAGDLRIRPTIDLAGIAIVLPDGIVTANGSTARLQLDGDVIAHTLILAGTGALHGNAAAVVTPTIAATIQRPGSGRAPRPWAARLELGEASDIRSLAVVSRVQTPADLPAILGFTFHGP
jgi:hypothetical protein